MKNLNMKSWFSAIALAIAMGLLLFVPAGTVDYWQAWVFLLVYFGMTCLILIYLLNKDPALMERRMTGSPLSETEISQKFLMSIMSLGFIALLVVPALDHRIHWSQVPFYVAILGDILVAVGWFIVFLVFRENSFTLPNIKVAADQKVVSTGPYAVVRHPMYAGSFLYCIGIPLALGSYWGLLAVAIMLPLGLWRLFYEERLLSKNLAGYAEYCKKVRWRLIPRIF
ncbi:MAG: isoprenylcysteine carboxylmethyltransferase family protein [Dehalococcoidia bacterium]